MSYLNFNSSNCRNCYKCLRECPVKAISVIDDKAQIIEDLCILCGHCANACRFNAKEVKDDREVVKKLLGSKKPIYVSLAPSFIASFDVKSFAAMENALKKLGFFFVEETAVGAAAITDEYKKLLKSGKYKNLIASACPAIVRLISQYYPQALPCLAPVDSPMVAHAKQLKKKFGKSASVVFIGPCLAKKREAAESGVIDAALTFEELAAMFSENGVVPEAELMDTPQALRARYYPINRGIIKSFDGFVDGYEYLSVDGVNRSKNVLENIDELTGMFIEMHACEFSCINGPCSLNKNGGFFKATERVRSFTKQGMEKEAYPVPDGDFSHKYERVSSRYVVPPEYEIRRILEATGKFKPEDELNCGACGYPTCRDKAIAVYNNMAQIDMCVPYMREKAESLSFDIIQNSPNGILAVDENFRITDINEKAAQLLDIPRTGCKGELIERYFNPTDFYVVAADGKPIDNKTLELEKSGARVEMSIRKVEGQNILFCIMKDVTKEALDQDRLDKLKTDTYRTTDEVIGKQMRVVQEIASLLGETAAETKIALLKLKSTLAQTEDKK